MMEINIHSREVEFYRISSDDFALIGIGLGSYTTSSLDNLLRGNNGAIPTDLIEFFRGEGDLRNKLLGIKDQAKMFMGDFNITSKKYEKITGFSNLVKLDPAKYNPTDFVQPPTTIQAFLTGWNNVQRGIISTKNVVNGYRAAVYRIQNSQEGCINFTTILKVLGTSRTSKIKIHFLESIDPESSRSVSFRGSPVITEVPQTQYNITYSSRNTANAPAGQFVGVSEGGNSNPQNTVSAPMDVAFDPSTNTWQSGTQQMLMRLLDDIEPATVPDMTPDQLLKTERVEYYETGVDSQVRIVFTKGRAIPMSSENGNVHMFGPDYRDGCAGKDQVVLQVLNKMNIAYKAGSVVVCAKMLGDGGLWTIINGIGREGSQAQKKVIFGNFEFQQYVIPMNYYFTDPISGARMMPDAWATKIRLSYYLKLLSASAELYGGLDAGTFRDIVTLNFAAANLTQGEENPIQALRTLYDPNPNIATITNECKVGGIDALDFINVYFCRQPSSASPVYSNIPPHNEHISDFALPKNVLKKTACTLSAGQVVTLPLNGNGGCDNGWGIGVDVVPIFWGMLFPDGYRIDTVRRFTPLILKDNGNGIFKDDPNLRELTCASTECSYDLQVPNNQVKNLLFSSYLGLNNVVDGNLSYVRTTGGLYRNLGRLNGIINNPLSLYNHVSMIPTSSSFEISRMNRSDAIYGAEPVNAGKIQFSSMSQEALYMASDIKETNRSLGFSHLYQALTGAELYNPDGAPAGLSGGLVSSLKYNSNKTFKEYAEFLIWNKATSPSVASTNSVDSLNRYNIYGLSVSNVFGNPVILNRHTPPIGVLMGSTVSIAPLINNTPRSVAMPVLTCKSTITTNAGSLLFTLNQSFGAIRKQTSSPGQGPQITFIPLGGGGAGWSLPGTDPKKYGFVQWGAGENQVDTCGTTSLHARVFEHVPPNQLIYIGPIFTPLHFGASEPPLQYETTTNANGAVVLELAKDEDGKSKPSISPNDFKIPTNKSGVPFALNSSVTEKTLASVDKWKNITVRRGKLLTRGGFAYFKNVIVVNTVVLSSKKGGGGRGYKQGDKLFLPDGSEIEITGTTTETPESGPPITGIISGLLFKPNFIESITKSSTSGLSSVDNISPTGGTGSGAEFVLTFTIKRDIGLDLEPMESGAGNANGTLLSSPNNRGEEYIDTEANTTIDLVARGNNRKYDIFYYYHNDPSHYSLDAWLTYSNAAAQYVICEVKAQ